ncbi:MAG TPA: hypothetical protein VF554_05430 [Thermoanaerobaculia bacterium]
MNPRFLSSRQTFVSKFVFPALWISLFGLGTLAMWTGVMTGEDEKGPPPAERWIFLALWTGGSAFILWSCAGLKRVRVDQRFLYVSNYRKEIAVPLNSIASVTENRWVNTHPVTIHFREPTEFGFHITFIPTMRLFGFWSSHPVVAELRAAALISPPPGA